MSLLDRLDRNEAQNDVVNAMIDKIAEIIENDGVSPVVGTTYILQGFTQDELRTFRLFVSSFRDYAKKIAAEV